MTRESIAVVSVKCIKGNMADNEKIRAMEEGHSIITSQSPPIDQQRENTEPASPSSRSWFSFGSSKPLGSFYEVCFSMYVLIKLDSF